MPDRERRGGRSDRGRSRSRSRSPRRRERDSKEERGTREHIRHYSRSRSRSRSPRKHRLSRSRSRSRSRAKSPRRHHDRQARSRSRSQHRRKRSLSSSSSSSSDRSDRHRKKRKDKHSRKRSRSRDKKEKKKDKRDKKKKKKSGAVTAQWGKHGIINETNQYDKEAEFRTWLMEERKINPETLSKDLTKKEFAKFVEDYNTATLPHEKYYNMHSYERRMALLRNGETLPLSNDAYDPNADLLAHSNAHKTPSTSKETYMSREQLQELRRVQAERSQVGRMKLMGMDVGQTFGVRMDGSAFDG